MPAISYTINVVQYFVGAAYRARLQPMTIEVVEVATSDKGAEVYRKDVSITVEQSLFGTNWDDDSICAKLGLVNSDPPSATTVLA